jgi:predicted Zn-dependent protease
MEFQRALSLDPDSAMTHQLYGLFLGSQGRAEEAIREGRRAVDLAPTSGLISFCFADILLHAGKYDETLAQSLRTMELDRGFYETYNVLARAYLLKGMNDQALQALKEWESHLPQPAQPLMRAHQLAKSGHREQALSMINDWLASSPRASRPPMELAIALLAAGEKDRALAAVRQSVEMHVPSMVWLKSTPELAEVRSDPRFAAAVSLMELE